MKIKTNLLIFAKKKKYSHWASDLICLRKQNWIDTDTHEKGGKRKKPELSCH